MTTQAPFVDGLSVPELGLGAGLTLWGFRACARGQVMCCAIIHGFERVFGDDTPAALSSLLALTRMLGVKGRRRIGLGEPGCAGVTADELSLVALFAAAQQGDDEKRDAHLAWLFGGAPPSQASAAADRVGAVFKAHRLTITTPPVDVSPRTAPFNGLYAFAGGRA